MEITGIDTLQSVRKLGSKEGVQATRLEDSVAISGEAKKRAEWVEMLKQMPDIRSEKVESAVQHRAASEVAEQMMHYFNL